jgi:VacB/RNase II family 3'-5' exoribonuclease
MAWMLIESKHWTLLELLQQRLAWRRKNNLNPFPPSYDSSLESWAETLPDVDAEAEISKGRTDLRHLQFVTIDPPDAKDFDDAICFEKSGNGSTLWVAIADVAHYVTPDSRLDATAQARATSVYLPHGVLPMLPFRLADDLCSLRANVPRLAMVIEMKLDENMTIVESKAHEAVIDVKENLAYEDTLEDSRWDELFTLAEHWQKDELRLNVQQGEQRPRIQEDGSVRIDVKWPNKATKMIETLRPTILLVKCSAQRVHYSHGVAIHRRIQSMCETSTSNSKPWILASHYQNHEQNQRVKMIQMN